MSYEYGPLVEVRIIKCQPVAVQRMLGGRNSIISGGLYPCHRQLNNYGNVNEIVDGIFMYLSQRNEADEVAGSRRDTS